MCDNNSLDSKKNTTNFAVDATTPVATVPPPTAAGRPPTSLLFSRGNLISSRIGLEKNTIARPSTAVRAVGYAANTNSAGQRFDQVFVERAKQKTLSSANATVDTTKEINPQMKYKTLEVKIIKLLEASIILAAHSSNKGISSTNDGYNGSSSNGIKTDITEALNKAKEAFSLDRTLHRFRDQQGENVFHNFDLTYSVFFNLAEQYENNDMHIEALNTYSIMTKNKMFPHVNQLKLNMGNIYYKMGIYPKAIKMFRMALDSVPNNLKQLRLKITQNIGTLFVRMGQYGDAAASFEFIMAERADIRNGIHLILCYYAMGDVEKIKNAFRNLCDVQSMETENDLENENDLIKLEQHNELLEQQRLNKPDIAGIDSNNVEEMHIHKIVQAHEQATNGRDTKNGSHFGKYRYIFKAIKCDELALHRKQQRNNNKRALNMIVDLISPIIEENYNDGYNWCIEVIKSSNLAWLAHELELNKAIVYLRQNDVNQAIDTLQMYDRKSEGAMTASALTNLSFIYINLGNMDMAAHCVNQLIEIGALQSNTMALVNASIIDCQNQNYSSARARLERALQIQPDNFEANYNLGLVAVQENDVALAEEQFELLKTQFMQLHSVQHSHVYYQLAKLQEQRNSTTIAGGHFKLTTTPSALQSYLQVLGISAAEIDFRIFEKVASIYEQIQDHQEANQYYNEAYRINPSDINIASSIGSYFIKLQAIEKALYYYERAVLADPNDPNLMLRIASCFRNSYLPPKQYLGMFETIYANFPDNLTCILALIQVTKSLGMTELNEKYSLEYARLHKQFIDRQNEQKYQQQRQSISTSGKVSNRVRVTRSIEENANLRSIEINPLTIGITSNFNGDHYIRSTENNFPSSFHTDPLGPPPERPRTGMVRNTQSNDSDEEYINTDSLLPM